MNQGLLDFSATHARRSDPATSHMAATGAERFAQSQAGRILHALQLHGPRTAHELSLITGLTVVQIDRRLPDLLKDSAARVLRLDDGSAVVRGGCRVWAAKSGGAQ
ncbi:MAG: hypothetical protein KGI71_04020 [Patescibacteria group bacterium]|nr:hypothetical protein [Patescibacteria group bacterium]